jgi:SM-20-related protein
VNRLLKIANLFSIPNQGDEKWENYQIRGDKIIWIKQTNDQKDIPLSLRILVQSMKQIQTEFNQSTNINTQNTESHLTCYPGNKSGYIRHLDATKTSHSQRKLTCLFYLNTEWQSGDGGELVIYNETKNIKIKPIAYRLLIFQSGCVEHQVLPTNVPRFAFTLWLH